MSKKHRARLTDQAGLEEFTIKASYGGVGIDYIYGTRDGKPELHAVDFDGDAIQATTAQAWLVTRGLVPAEFVADAGPDVFAAWVASSSDTAWDADDSSRKADAATRDAEMPAEHHQQTKHASAAAAHRRAAADHEKTAVLHDTEGRESEAAGDANSANDHKRQGDEARVRQARHAKQAAAHDRQLKKLLPALADADEDGDAADDSDEDGDSVDAVQVPDATPLSAARASASKTAAQDPPAIHAVTDQQCDEWGRFAATAHAATKTADDKSAAVAKGKDKAAKRMLHGEAAAAHRSAADLHRKAAAQYDVYDSATPPDDEWKKKGTGMKLRPTHQHAALRHHYQAQAHEDRARVSTKYVMANVSGNPLAIVASSVTALRCVDPDEPILAYNPYHEGGTGRFTSGSGGTKKLQDQGANASSDVAHAASRSAHSFTGSHAAATKAHMEAASVAEGVRQRSKAAFGEAVTRRDSLAAVAHANEASNAEHNVNLHQRLAMEHQNRATAETAHAINTGLARALPGVTPGEGLPDVGHAMDDAPTKKRGMVARAVVGLAKLGAKATVATVKAPFQVAGWAIDKLETGRKARGAQRAKDREAKAAKDAFQAAGEVERATGAAKAAPLGLPAPSPARSSSAPPDDSRQSQASRPSPPPLPPRKPAGQSPPPLPPRKPSGQSTPPLHPSPSTHTESAVDQLARAMDVYRRATAGSGGASGSTTRSTTATGAPRPPSKQLPYRPWEVAEAAQRRSLDRIEAVAAAIAAVRSNPKAE